MVVGSLDAGRNWLRAHGEGAAVVPHHDADGLAAGALLARATRGTALHVESPWTAPLPVAGPAIVADWGVRPVSGPSALLYVDDHAGPEYVDGTVVTPRHGAGASTSMVTWKLLRRPADGAWLAALGAVGDLGEDALRRRDVPRVDGSGEAMAELASLVTAPGQLHDGPVDQAFELLKESEDERAALADPRRPVLADAAARVQEAQERAMRSEPQVAGDVALVRFTEPARIHPTIAAAWAKRLAPRVVIAANDGWRDGQVAFSVRSASPRDLRAWLLTRYSPPPGTGDYARGHASATGGVLDTQAFEDFAAAALAQAARPGRGA
jgi:hypothetical protein